MRELESRRTAPFLRARARGSASARLSDSRRLGEQMDLMQRRDMGRSVVFARPRNDNPRAAIRFLAPRDDDSDSDSSGGDSDDDSDDDDDKNKNKKTENGDNDSDDDSDDEDDNRKDKGKNEPPQPSIPPPPGIPPDQSSPLPPVAGGGQDGVGTASPPASVTASNTKPGGAAGPSASSPSPSAGEASSSKGDGDATPTITPISVHSDSANPSSTATPLPSSSMPPLDNSNSITPSTTNTISPGAASQSASTGSTPKKGFPLAAAGALGAVLSFIVVSGIIWGLWFWLRRRRRARAHPEWDFGVGAGAVPDDRDFSSLPSSLRRAHSMTMTGTDSTGTVSTVPQFLSAHEAGVIERPTRINPFVHPHDGPEYDPFEVEADLDSGALQRGNTKRTVSTMSV